MADIAELGLKIDSSQAGQAARALDQMTTAGRKAEDQFAKIERAARMGGQGTQGYTQALGQAYGITQQMSAAQVSAIRNYETMIAKTQLLNEGRGREAAQLVAVRKAGTTANTEYGRAVASLAGNLYDLEQQGGKTNNTFSKFADTLTRRFVIGYLVTQLRQMVTTIIALNTELAKTGDVARFTGIGTQDLQGIQFAGALKGVDSGKLLEDMTSFAKQVNLAKQGLGDLHTLFRLNRETVGSTQEAFLKVADLVKNARSDIEKFSILQAVGLPATREYVRLMEQGSAALKEQAKNAPKIDPAEIKRAQELEDQYNRIIKLGTDFFKSDFVKSAKAFEDALKQDFAILSAVYEVAAKIGLAMATWRLPSSSAGENGLPKGVTINPPGSQMSRGPSAPVTAVTSAALPSTGTVTLEQLQALQKRNSLQQQYLGLLGQTATVEQQVLAVRLQIQANQMNPDAIRLTKEQIANLERLARERALGTDQMKAQTDAYNVEAAAIGMSVGAAAEFTAVQTKLNEALRLGTGDFDLNTEAGRRNYQMLVENAGRLGEAAQRADNLRFGYDTFSGTMREFGSNIRSGQTAMEAFGNAGVNALGKIADRLMDMASRQLWNAAFPNGGGGLFSWITGSTGGAGDFVGNPWSAGSAMPIIGHTGGMGYELGFSGRYVHPAYFDDAPRFHKGKLPWGPGEMPAIIKPEEAVLTPGQLRAVASMGGSPSPAPTRPLVVNVFPVAGSTMDVTQMPDGSLEIVGRMIDQKIKSFDKALPARVLDINSKPRER